MKYMCIFNRETEIVGNSRGIVGRTFAQAEVLAEKLRALPPIDNKQRIISKQEEIKLLAAEITALQTRGYTLQQIAEYLTQEGLEIGAPTLKSYLQRSKVGARKPSAKRKPRERTAKSAESTESVIAGNPIATERMPFGSMERSSATPKDDRSQI